MLARSRTYHVSYGSRLPETSNMLRQKLGGPKTPSPMRPPLVKAASSSHLAQKPGTNIQRSGVRKARATLERVLTDEKSASQRRAPGLSRSNTDSALPGLKREVSDTSLTAIPLNRVALHKSKRYSQREVDLKAVSQAVEAKLKKKASVEQELQGAIATMKKPNPRMAVKELVEAAERRVAGPHSRSNCPFHIADLQSLTYSRNQEPSQEFIRAGCPNRGNPKGQQAKRRFWWLTPSTAIDSGPGSGA